MADIAWESTTTGYAKYITDERYQKFSDEVKRWYKPYRCSSCDELTALRGRIAKLEKVLEPFAKEASEFNDEYRVDWQLADQELVGSQFTDLTFGDFRAARAALTEAKDGWK